MMVTIRTFLLSLLSLSSSLHAATEDELAAALREKGADYQPRTEHLKKDGSPIYTNRLILAESPYLLQHAHNPVNWYPWGNEAFTVAKKENKAIFLSIGYSTCHWCHVMEDESFDNEAIAKLMNKYFISIKVDREQYPDIDETYMTAVMLMTGSGGWPMSSFINAKGKTFWAGTYIPPQQFSLLLPSVHNAWVNKRDEVDEQADKIAELVTEITAAKQTTGQIDSVLIKHAANIMLQGYDPQFGGFSPAPKFPNEADLFFLLDQIKRTGNQSQLNALTHTLNAMAQGGLYDQVAGGFHRYATDTQWLVPHFEKMLYNQAHLARVYLQAYDITADPFYARIARQTLDYILREMSDSKGGFYSASDADSEGREGAFYLWTPTQIKAVLSPAEATLAITLFGITEAGNFEGKNILHLPVSLADYAQQNNLKQTDLYLQLDAILLTLRTARAKRPAPFRDNKIITAWNGMMITTLAQASNILKAPHYLAAAERTADFLWQHNHPNTGELLRIHLNGKSSTKAIQEDYAYLAEGLIALYDASQKTIYLAQARELTDSMISQFWDDESGGFYMGGINNIPIMARPKQGADGAIPSGNSVAVNVLAMLTRRTPSFNYERKANQTIAAFYQTISASPAAYGYLLQAVEKLQRGDISARQYAAKGAIKVHAVLNAEHTLSLSLSIPAGWHINSATPLDTDLIPTQLTLAANSRWQLTNTVYPKATEKQLDFSPQKLALYHGNIQITAQLHTKNKQTDDLIPLQLTLQACNNQQCLPPETLYFKLRRRETD